MDELKAIFDGATMKALAEYLEVHVTTLYWWEKIPKKYKRRVKEFTSMQVTRIEQFTENLTETF
jgi:hypothetical protein